MIKIALVDDQQEELDNLCAHFRSLQKTVREELEIHTFSSGAAFLAAYDSSFDLVCLDIDLGETADGMAVARELRRRDKHVILLFITNMAQMAVQGYEVRALDFVVKPVNYYSFAIKLQSAIQIAARRKTKRLVVTTANGLERFSTDELYYAETNGHYLCYHTTRGEFRQKGSMKDLQEKLESLPFRLCSQSYLVNLNHVSAVNRDDVQVGGVWLKMSRPKKKAFLSALTNYLGGDM
jgi:DNA-binding LytR/AlgR family response regulator